MPSDWNGHLESGMSTLDGNRVLAGREACPLGLEGYAAMLYN